MKYLQDGEIARINCEENLEIKTINNEKRMLIQQLKINLETIEKDGFPILY